MSVKDKLKKSIPLLSVVVSLAIICTITVIRIYKNKPSISDNGTFGLIDKLSFINLGETHWSLIGISLFILILVSLKVISKKNSVFDYALILTALSPTFLYYAINPQINILFLFLLSLILLTTNYEKKIFTIILSTLLLSFNSGMILFASLMFLLLQFYHKEQKYLRNIFALLFVGAILKLVYFKDTVFSKELILNLVMFVQEFGLHYGVSIIVIIFAVLGLISFWSRRSYPEVILILMTIISIAINEILLFNAIIIYYAAKMIKQFSETNWEVKALETGVLILIVLLFINSLSILISETTNGPPVEEEIKIYEQLDGFSGKTLYDFKRGYTLDYYTDLSSYAKDVRGDNAKIATQIYYSTKLSNTVSLLREEGIKYILITEEMTEKYWDNKTTGLLIMANDPDYFKLVYSEDEFKLWEVVS